MFIPTVKDSPLLKGCWDAVVNAIYARHACFVNGESERQIRSPHLISAEGDEIISDMGWDLSLQNHWSDRI